MAILWGETGVLGENAPVPPGYHKLSFTDDGIVSGSHWQGQSVYH